MSQLEIVHVCQFLELESKVYFSTQLKRKTSALKNKEGLCENKPKDIPLTAGQARVSNPWLDPRASTYIQIIIVSAGIILGGNCKLIGTFLRQFFMLIYYMYRS